MSFLVFQLSCTAFKLVKLPTVFIDVCKQTEQTLILLVTASMELLSSTTG